MKNLLLAVSMCAALLVGGCGKEDEKDKEIARLQKELDESNQRLDDMMKSVDDVYGDLESIHTKESEALRDAERTGGEFSTADERLDNIRAELKENRRKIAQLETRAHSSRGNTAELQNGIKRLKGRLDERDRSLTQLEERMRRSRPAMSEVQFERRIKSLAKGLNSTTKAEQRSAAEAALELKQAYPDRNYAALIIPLMRVVKNDDAERATRMPAAQALHLMHSDRGDYAIDGVSRYSNDREFRRYCTKLAAQRAEENDLARMEREKPEPATLTER
ncbi:MAG: hypothetical protein HY961_04000 [Ignavibacteriae bacterium]|nr:hypothetical protein [Ignavibacteriota bacterium]